MSKVQTRRCVSLKRPVYDKIKNYCELNHISMSSFVESALEANVPYLLQAAKEKTEKTEETPKEEAAPTSKGLPVSAPPTKRLPGNIASF